MEGEDHGPGRRIAKRAKRNKGLAVVFDEAARQEFVTGFRKRKNKRRKIAEAEKQEKDRKKRIHDRHERRTERKKALGMLSDSEKTDNEDTTGDQEDNNDLQQDCVVYEDEHTRTVVNTCPIVADDFADDSGPVVIPRIKKKKNSRSYRPKHKRQRG